MPGLETKNLALLFLVFDDLLEEEVYEEDLSSILEHGDDAMLAAFLTEELPDSLDLEEKLAHIKVFYNLVFAASFTVLDAVAEALSIPLDEKLFMKISQEFLTFEESWEKFLGRKEFVAFSDFFTSPRAQSPLPLQHLLIISFVLARSAEGLEAAKQEGLDLLELAMELSRKFVKQNS